MMSFVFASAALAGVALATGAAADPKNSAAKPEKARAAEPRYCVVEVQTGSRIRTKVCKTRREWLAEGVDPLDP